MPKELDILIPDEDEEIWASQYYRAYNATYGLVCKGDGDLALRMVDNKTKGLPGKTTSGFEMLDIKCLGKACPEYKTKKCGEVMNLRFILPAVPGLGVWQIDTGSINSILNINSCGRLIKKAFGRISLVPLKLTLEPIEVNNPETGKKQKVFVLNLRTNVTLQQLASVAREQAKMLSVGDLAAKWKQEVEQDIADFWPEVKPTEETPEPAAVAPESHKEGAVVSAIDDWATEVSKGLTILKGRWPFKEWAAKALDGAPVNNMRELKALSPEHKDKFLLAMQGQLEAYGEASSCPALG